MQFEMTVTGSQAELAGLLAGASAQHGKTEDETYLKALEAGNNELAAKLIAEEGKLKVSEQAIAQMVVEMDQLVAELDQQRDRAGAAEALVAELRQEVALGDAEMERVVGRLDQAERDRDAALDKLAAAAEERPKRTRKPKEQSSEDPATDRGEPEAAPKAEEDHMVGADDMIEPAPPAPAFEPYDALYTTPSGNELACIVTAERDGHFADVTFHGTGDKERGVNIHTLRRIPSRVFNPGDRVIAEVNGLGAKVKGTVFGPDPEVPSKYLVCLEGKKKPMLFMPTSLTLDTDSSEAEKTDETPQPDAQQAARQRCLSGVYQDGDGYLILGWSVIFPFQCINAAASLGRSEAEAKGILEAIWGGAYDSSFSVPVERFISEVANLHAVDARMRALNDADPYIPF